MAFQKKTWLARLGQGLNKFIFNGGSKVTLDSSPDVVTQEGTPLSAENMNDLEQRIEEGITSLFSLLWTNPNPTSDFPAQTISLDLSAYKAVVILCREFKGSSRGFLTSAVCPVGYSCTVLCPYISSDNMIRNYTARHISVLEDGVVVSTCYNSESTTTTDTNAIPVFIYGIE